MPKSPSERERLAALEARLRKVTAAADPVPANVLEDARRAFRSKQRSK
jgi:hypothetical protein